MTEEFWVVKTANELLRAGALMGSGTEGLRVYGSTGSIPVRLDPGDLAKVGRAAAEQSREAYRAEVRLRRVQISVPHRVGWSIELIERGEAHVASILLSNPCELEVRGSGEIRLLAGERAPQKG